MSMKNTKKDGFTIIEVVLVLAIAGLIFLMIFIALPALQRSSRDSTRRNEVGTVISAISSYMNTNRNRLPTDARDVAAYVTGRDNDPTLDSGATLYIVNGTGQTMDITADVSAVTSNDPGKVSGDEIKIYFGYKCGDEAGQIVRGTSKQSAVVTAVESGPASGSVYCQTG